MSCFGCFFRLLLLVALIKNQFGRYLLVQVEETKKINIPQGIQQVQVEETKKIDIPQVIPQIEVEEEKKIDIPLPLTRGNCEFKDTNSSKHLIALQVSILLSTFILPI